MGRAGPDACRRNQRHKDIKGQKFPPNSLGITMQCKFSSAIGAVKGPTYIRTNRRDVDNLSGALRQHDGRCCLHHVNRAKKVDVDLIAQLCHGQLFMRADQFISGVVDQNV